MPLSQSTLDEIRSELTHLHQAKVRIDERVRALESILTPFDFRNVGLPFAPVEPTAGGNGHRPAEAESGDALNDTGLRSAILGVLRELGPVRAPKVAETLLARGFKDTGKTRFSTRVYNDLWRMSQTGKIDNKNGMFSVK